MDLAKAVNLVSDAFSKIAKVANGAASPEQAAEAFHIVGEQNPELIAWLTGMLAALSSPQGAPPASMISLPKGAEHE